MAGLNETVAGMNPLDAGRIHGPGAGPGGVLPDIQTAIVPDGENFGFYACGGVCCAVVAFIWLADTFWLLCPRAAVHFQNRSQMLRAYGPLLGVKNVPTFDAALLLVMYTPIVTLVWVASQSIAWLPTLCLAFSVPFLCMVGIYFAITNFMPAPISFVVLSSLHGAMLLWRCADPVFQVDPRYLPVVLGWALLCSLVFGLCVARLLKRAVALNPAIELELSKIQGLHKSGVWKAGFEGPDGWYPETQLAVRAKACLQDAHYTSGWSIMALLLFMVTAVGGGMALVWNMPFEHSLSSPETRHYNWVLAAVVLAWEGTTVYYICKGANGGLRGVSEKSEKSSLLAGKF